MAVSSLSCFVAGEFMLARSYGSHCAFDILGFSMMDMSLFCWESSRSLLDQLLLRRWRRSTGAGDLAVHWSQLHVWPMGGRCVVGAPDSTRGTEKRSTREGQFF